MVEKEAGNTQVCATKECGAGNGNALAVAMPVMPISETSHISYHIRS
jgi:hypothetical protein